MIEKRVIRVFFLTSLPFQGFSYCAKTYQFHLKIYQASISFIFEDFIVQIELACILKKWKTENSTSQEMDALFIM